jgi:hypothetical protein
MPMKITEVYVNGRDEGYQAGFQEGDNQGWERGYASGFDEGMSRADARYEEGLTAGKAEVYSEIEPINAQLENTLNGTDTGGKSYYDEFWDNFQDYGKRVFYGHAFRNSSFEYIRPKYKVRVSERNSAANLFYYSVSLKKVEAEYFDFSQLPFGLYSGEGLSSTFNTCSALTEIEDVGLSPSIGYAHTFAWCPNLKTIAKITVDENTAYSNTFNNCFALENLTIEGVIGQDGFNVQWSTKLSKASIISIINALSTTASGKSVTLSKVAVESAFGSTASEEWISLITARSNWTINLV